MKNKSKKIRLSYKKEKFVIDLKICNWFEKFSGLMFSRREKAKSLLFDFKRPVKKAIHSYFVFFPFIAIWLNDKNKVIDFKIVKPFTSPTFPKKSFSKIIEIPINKKYEKIVGILVGDRKI